MAVLPKIINEQLPPIHPAHREAVATQIEEACNGIRNEMEDRLKALDDVFLSFGEQTTEQDYFPFNHAALEMHFWVGGDIQVALDFIRDKGSLAGAFLMTKKAIQDRDWIFPQIDKFIEVARKAKSIDEVEWNPKP